MTIRQIQTKVLWTILATALTVCLAHGQSASAGDAASDLARTGDGPLGSVAQIACQHGNDANGGWVLPGEQNEVYIGTEHGLFRLGADNVLWQYTSYPAQWLHRYGEYLIYTEHDRDSDAGLGIYAFDLTPLSEPYPTELLYDGAASYVQVDAAAGWIYFLGDGVLYRASLSPLDVSTDGNEPIHLQPEAIAWESPATTGGDAAPSPHEAPQIPALSSQGIFALIGRSGARYEENTYLYSLDGQQAKRIDILSDSECRGTFWFDPAQLLFCKGEQTEYDGLGASGIYALDPDSQKYVRLSDDPKSDFAVWYDAPDIPDGEYHPIWLVTAGGVAEGSRIGVYATDIGGEKIGEPVCLYDGPAMCPNAVNGYIYFRAPAQREDGRYDYCRVPVDGSTGVQRLDFVKGTVETK